MLVSLNWLNEYVDLDGLAAAEIAEALTNAGLEVESIEASGPVFSGVLVGKVTQVSQHPNADRLRLVDVDLGPAGKNKVVCGAPNVAEGMLIAYAQLGAQVVNKKEGGLFQLKPATIRGVESVGMICSLEELGLESQYSMEGDGIWPLNALLDEKTLGQDLKTALNLASDTVLDVTPNANRGDLMSMVGVAREVAALFKRAFKLPTIAPVASFANGTINIALSDASVCQFYQGAVLNTVNITPSPEWMRQRLQAAGVRVINNVVDITNYVMLELGQPLHAFDIAKLGQSGTIDVRYAKPGETLLALDEVSYSLSETSIVVTYNDKPVALAGVMGGQETGISDSTQQVFLEVAYFPSATTRKSARSVGLRSESSARFERGVDPGAGEQAFARAIELLQKLAGATVASIQNADVREKAPLTLPLRLSRLEQILGLAISSEDVKAILSPLGFETMWDDTANQFTVTVPTFRQHDVTREIDLIEEIIRIYGYDAIPYTLPQETVAPTQSLRRNLLKQIRSVLTGVGLTEITTHSLIGHNLLQRTGFSQNPDETVSVTNSQSQDHTFLRHSLLPNLLDIAQHNQAQGNENLWLFELGKTYFKRRPAQPKYAGVEELLHLSGLITGTPQAGTWHQTSQTDFYTLKGVLENLLTQLLPTESPTWAPAAEHPALHPGQSASLQFGKVELGIFGRLHPILQSQLKLKSSVYIFEINIEKLYKLVSKQTQDIKAEALSAFPAVHRDIAFSISNAVSHQDIIIALQKAETTLLQDIMLFDEYRGDKVAQDTRSLAYRLTLQSADATLTDTEIDAAMDKIKRQLSEQLPVTYR